MIYIISLIMLMVSLIGGSILVAAGPNVKAIVDRDFAKKSYATAKLASLQYGDIALRAHTVIHDTAAAPSPNAIKKMPSEWLIRKDGANSTVENATIHVYLNTTSGQEIIDSDITQDEITRGLY